MSNRDDATAKDNSKQVRNLRIGVFGSIGAAIAVLVGLQYYYHPGDGPEDTRDFLKIFAEEAAGSVGRYDTVAAVCTPALAAAVNAELQPLPYQTTVSMVPAGNYCDLRIANTETGEREVNNLLGAQDVEGKTLTEIAKEAVGEFKWVRAPEYFCYYFNETVVPKLTEAGVDGLLHGEVKRVDSQDHCVIQRGGQGEDSGHTFVALFNRDDFKFGTADLKYPEEEARYILSGIPIADRRLIASNLPGLLAPQTPQP